MKYAADFRKIAREALYEKWRIAAGVFFIASLLGGASTDGLSVKLEMEESFVTAVVRFAGITVGSFGGGRDSAIGNFLLENAKVIVLAFLIASIFSIVFGCVVEIGYKRFHLNLIDGKEVSLKNLFQNFYNWKRILCAVFLEILYVTIGFLLFIVPGIVAIYNYSMVSYILAEYPELSASEALRKSKEMMKGNRWRLFCLEISFIGWEILCAFSLGIGQLFLVPYKETAIAAFYREVSETWDEPAAVVLEDASKQRNGVVAVLLIFGLIATTAVLFKVGLSNVKDTKEDTVVTEQRIHGNLYRVSKSINKELFSDELWNSVTKIEYFEGSEYPYVVRSKETLQEIGDLIKNLEHKKVEKPMLEGGWIFDIYTEDAMSDIWISNNIIDFNGRCYQVSTEGLGDKIRELVMNNFEMQLRIDEYVTNDYQIKLLDKPKGYDEVINLEIQFLTDKESHILQNTVKVEHLGEATGFDVKLDESSGRTKTAQVSSERYKLTFNFDVETCEVFDVRKIVNY